MNIVIVSTPAHAERLAARIVADRVAKEPSLVLGCATGGTMEGVYDALVTMATAEAVDFSRVRTFNLDEYVGVATDDERSYYHYMNERFFSRVNLDPANCHVPDGSAPDPEAEAAAFEAKIAKAGGVGLQLLGIGNNGHIGFNEPLSSFASRTRVQPLAPRTREQNAPHFGGDPAAVPATALTMGVGTILESKEALLVATGAHKANILATTLEGPITGVVTATALHLHPDCTVIADEAAAAGLALTDFYRATAAAHPRLGRYEHLFD